MKEFNKQKLSLAFSEAREALKLDFAIEDASIEYGGTVYDIEVAGKKAYGANARGIFGYPKYCNNGALIQHRVMLINLNRTEAQEVAYTLSVMGYFVTPSASWELLSLDEIPEKKLRRKFFIDTPLGHMVVRAKPTEHQFEYPGVYIDLKTSKDEIVDLACVEYAADNNTIAVDVYPNGEYSNYAERTEIVNIPGADLVSAKRHIMSFLKADDGDEESIFANLKKVPLTYTDVEYVEALSIQVYADLEDPGIVTCIRIPGGEEVVVSQHDYDSLEDLDCSELEILDFDSLVSIYPEEWDVFCRSKAGLKWLREIYPSGIRVLLTAEMDDPQPVPLGTAGNVAFVDDIGQIHVKWDNGSTLALLFGRDFFEIIEEG